MADQSAIRIPQGQLPINLVDSLMRLYCSPLGSDSTGDGSLTNPYFHPNRALQDLNRLFFTEIGSAIIQCAEGTYNYEYPIIVDNKTNKNISIAGEVGRSFKLQEVTSYKYDAIENITANGYGVGSLIDQRITVKMAKASELIPPPSSVVSPSVDNINVGDYIIFKDETSKSTSYYPTGKDGSLGSEGLTGPNPGDARTNVLGCFEIIAVEGTNNTVTFRSRGKNFLHKIGKSTITNGDDISVDDNIYAGGGYRSENDCETGDPSGKYGTLATTGIDPTEGASVVSDHAISAYIVKTVFKFRRPSTQGRNSAVKGLVIKPNSSLAGLSNIALQGDVRFKHFNEMDAAASNGECILAFKNSSIGSGIFVNIGISGWYAGVVAHTNSTINMNGTAISDCSFGIVAENNSHMTAQNCVVTGCDIIGIVANNNSTISSANTTVGSAGYSPITLDLNDVGSDVSGLDAGDLISILVEEGEAVTTRCVWNSYKLPRDKMIDPVFDLYNYYPLNTGNQIYLRSIWPTGGSSEWRHESTNESSPNRIITSGGLLYGVGGGVLPENSSASTYEADEECGSDFEDLAGGVCKQPGYFGDPFDFLSTGDGGFLNFGGTDISCTCTCEQCEDGSCDTDGVCHEYCCGCSCDYACDNCDGEEQAGCDCDGGTDPPDCTGDQLCENSECRPGEGDPGYCSWCEQCGNPGDCWCFCNSGDPCCVDDTSCECTGEDPACCGVVCTDPVMCNESPCCCESGDVGEGGFPCYCSNATCSGPPGDQCPGWPGLWRPCTDCPVGDPCPCPPDTDHAGTCTRPCNNVEPPDETTYVLIDHPFGIGILAHNNSSIDATRSFVSLLRNGGYVAMENSSIDANLSFVRGCAGPGYLARENSSINARNSSAQRTRGGYTARQNSNIQAQMSYARDNANYNFIATNDSIVNCEKATSAISRTMQNASTDTTETITTLNEIYAGLSTAHGSATFGSFINKTEITELESDPVTPDGADKWAVDGSSNIEPSTVN